MAHGTNRHQKRRYTHERCSKLLDFIGCIVDMRKKPANYKHYRRDKYTAKYTEHDHLIIRILRLFQLAGSQILSYNDADTCTKLNIHNIKQIRDRRCDV